jgi:hypothetical protein
MLHTYSIFLQVTMLFVWVPVMTNLSLGQTKWDIKDDGCGGVKWEKGLYGNYDEEQFFLTSRETSLNQIPNELKIDGGKKGGVRATAWDKNEIWVKYCIQARGRTVEEAQKIASSVSVTTDKATLKGMSLYDNEEDSPYIINYDIKIPKNVNLTINTLNGGINIAGMDSTIDFSVGNGGAVLNNLSGNVRGKINNGSITVKLTGQQWIGRGLDTSIGNGSILILVPKDYSAKLETGTRWGTLFSEVGRISKEVKNNQISLDIGGGGNTIKALTGSGNVQINYY